jgi:hypothetical protein
MRKAAAAFILLSLSAAAEARAPIDPFCVALQRMTRAAGENPPFRSISQPVPLPGFNMPCGLGVDHGRRLICSIEDNKDPQLFDRLVARTMRCLPGTTRLADGPGLRHTRLRIGGAVISVQQVNRISDPWGADYRLIVMPSRGR